MCLLIWIILLIGLFWWRADPCHSEEHKQMGNSSPPVLTSRSHSLGGSSRLCRQPGRVLSLPLPSAGTSAQFPFLLMYRESSDLSVALSLACWWDMCITATLPVFDTSTGFAAFFFMVNISLSECKSEPPNSVFFPVCHVWPPFTLTPEKMKTTYLLMILLYSDLLQLFGWRDRHDTLLKAYINQKKEAKSI